MVAALFAVTEVFLLGPGPRDAGRWIGFGLGVIGVAGVISARYTLGRSFSVTAQARELVTGGIYSRIRNPIYVASGIMIVGILLMVREPWLWLILVALVPVQTIRARNESRVLEAKFGDEYRRYREGVWF